MSQDNKTTPSSSLGSLTKPASSPPISPQLSSVRTSKTTSIIDSASNMNSAIEHRLNAFEVAQQKSASDINRLTSMMEMLLHSQSTMKLKLMIVLIIMILNHHNMLDNHQTNKKQWVILL
jgi:hypothetical protein